MIHSLEDKTKRELIEICKIQIEEYQQLTKQFNYVVDLYESRIENMELSQHKSELKITSLEAELSTSKAWHKIGEEEMVTLNKQVKGGAK